MTDQSNKYQNLDEQNGSSAEDREQSRANDDLRRAVGGSARGLGPCRAGARTASLLRAVGARRRSL